MTISDTNTQISKPSLAIVGTVGLPANYGGWETLVTNTVETISEEFDVSVFCSSKRYDTQLDTYKGAKLHYVGLDANGISSIPYDIISLWRTRKFDRVLVLGTSGCVMLPLFRLFTRCEYILNIDGLEWKRDKWSRPARWFLRLSEILGCLSAHKLVSDNAVIKEHITKSYRRKSALIAYGGDFPDKTAESPPIPTLFDGQDYCFSVCRIEPENNIEMVLQACAASPKRNLVLIGNWASSSYGQRLKKEFGDYPNLQLMDPIYDRFKLDQYRANCTVYLHGHSAGGTNPSLVEAMYLGLPIVVFDVNFNRETMEDTGRFFSNATQLGAHVDELLADKDARTALGASLQKIAERRYTWEIISQQYIDTLR